MSEATLWTLLEHYISTFVFSIRYSSCITWQKLLSTTHFWVSFSLMCLLRCRIIPSSSRRIIVSLPVLCSLSLSFLCLSFPFNLLIEVMLVFIEWLSSSRISWYVRLETLVQRKPWRMILYTVVYPASPFHVISFSSSCLPSTQHNRNRMIQVIHYRSCFVNEEAVFFDTEQLFFFLFTLLKSLFWRLFFSLYNKHRRWREEKKRSVVKWRQQSIKIIWLII